LPIFKGDILHWSSFWEVVESRVDSKSYGGATKLVSKVRVSPGRLDWHKA
jgi:hypothetical protein